MAEFLVDEDGRAPYGVDMRRPEQACSSPSSHPRGNFTEHGEICWKLMWVIIILDIFRQEQVSKKRHIS